MRQGKFSPGEEKKKAGADEKLKVDEEELGRKLSAVQEIFWKGAGEKLGGVGVELRKKWNQKVAVVSVAERGVGGRIAGRRVESRESW